MALEDKGLVFKSGILVWNKPLDQSLCTQQCWLSTSFQAVAKSTNENHKLLKREFCRNASLSSLYYLSTHSLNLNAKKVVYFSTNNTRNKIILKCNFCSDKRNCISCVVLGWLEPGWNETWLWRAVSGQNKLDVFASVTWGSSPSLIPCHFFTLSADQELVSNIGQVRDLKQHFFLKKKRFSNNVPTVSLFCLSQSVRNCIPKLCKYTFFSD